MKSQELVQKLEVTENVTVSGGVVTSQKVTPAAINADATATVAEILGGYITSTTAAAVAITTPTPLALALACNAKAYDYFDITIQNTGSGGNNITLTGVSGLTVCGTATVADGKAAMFRFLFTSVTVTSGAISAAVVKAMRIAG